MRIKSKRMCLALIAIVLVLISVGFTIEPTILSGGNDLVTYENLRMLDGKKGMTITEVEAILGKATSVATRASDHSRIFVGKRRSDYQRLTIRVHFNNGKMVGAASWLTSDPTYFKMAVDAMKKVNQ